MNHVLLIATVRREQQLIARFFAVIDMTYMDEEEILDHAEHELRSNIEYTYCKIVFDILPLVALVELGG